MHELNAEEKEPYSCSLSSAKNTQTWQIAAPVRQKSKIYVFVSIRLLAGRYESTQIALLYAIR
jgi:hypothetical protein